MRNFGRKYQGGWFWIPAAISAVATLAGQAKQAHSDRQARLAAQEAADRQRAQDIALQQQYATNSLQWKVDDARKAGLHPLYALGGSGASYQSPGIAVYQGSSSAPWAGMGQALGRGIEQVADAYSREARGVVSPGPLDDRSYQEKHGYDAWWDQQGNAAPGDRPGPYVSKASGDYADQFGIAGGKPGKALSRFEFPGIGIIYAPNPGPNGSFTDALEGIESALGQGLVLYANRHHAKRVIEWIRSMMPKSAETRPLSTSELMELGRKYSQVVAP